MRNSLFSRLVALLLVPLTALQVSASPDVWRAALIADPVTASAFADGSTLAPVSVHNSFGTAEAFSQQALSGYLVNFLIAYAAGGMHQMVAQLKTESPASLKVLTWPRQKFQDPIGGPILLLILTIGSTTFAGMHFYQTFLSNLHQVQVPFSGALFWGGLSYAGAVVSILGVHELGHYLACRYYNVDATWPHFIPLPFGFIGTFGAIIRILEPFRSKKEVFDMGVAGPIAGFLLAVPTLLLGLSMSQVVPIPAHLKGYIFGGSLLLKLCTHLIVGHIPAGYMLNMHPVAIAGWIGLFATALNLMPILQLDGGHLSYAVFGRRSKYITIAALPILVALSVINPAWIVWTILIGYLTFVRGAAHPRTRDESSSIGPGRKLVAAAALAIFILCFTPMPFQLHSAAGLVDEAIHHPGISQIWPAVATFVASVLAMVRLPTGDDDNLSSAAPKLQGPELKPAKWIIRDSADLRRKGTRADTEMAIQMVKEAIPDYPDESKLHTELANCYLSLRQARFAVEPAEEGVRLAPDNPVARLTLANAYFRTERIEEAIAQKEAQLELTPGDPKAKQVLAGYYERMAAIRLSQNDFGGALWQLSRADRLDHGNPRVADKIRTILEHVRSAAPPERHLRREGEGSA
jgi:hypothetical protein